ncbi:MAG: type II secretion system protein, partial [Anaerovorax sp.]
MKKKAFTLVEVMAVVALISVLFVILVPRFGFAADKVKKVGVQTDFHAYETALRTVSLERGRLTNITSDQTSAADKSKALASAVNEYLDPEMRIVANPDGSLSTPKKDPWQNPYGIGYSEASDALYVYSSGPDAKKDQAYDTVPTATTGDDMIVSCRRGTL